MQHGVVAAVNLHLASHAALFISLEGSAWTDLQAMILDATWCYEVRCEGSTLRVAVCGANLGDRAAEDYIRATDLAPSRCAWSGGPDRWRRVLGLVS
eukprot:1225321-Prymnesium_polylepis.1